MIMSTVSPSSWKNVTVGPIVVLHEEEHALRARIHRIPQIKFSQFVQKHYWEGEKKGKYNGDPKALRIKMQAQKPT